MCDRLQSVFSTHYVYTYIGECFDTNLETNLNEYGCLTSFDTMNLQVALIMIFVDGILFGVFGYEWYKIVSKMKGAQTDNKIPKEVWQGFAIQFICVIVAMTSCSIDGIINFLYMDYDTLFVFLIDCALVSTANFAMLKESQEFLTKQLKAVLCIYSLIWSGQKNSNLDTVISEKTEKKNPSKTREGETMQHHPSKSNLNLSTSNHHSTADDSEIP